MATDYRNRGSRDDLWDLASLVPPKKPRSTSIGKDTEAVEVVLPANGTARGGDVPLTERSVSLSPAAAPPAPIEAYTPPNSLLREVRIYRWKSTYDYYEPFCRHAHQLFAREGQECPFVEFFSYMPQYTQLDRAQLAYYLWWRTAFRRGVILEASFSYLLLYLYELINLEERDIAPETARDAMLRLWLAYRGRHPRLDGLLREWICDYSLVHRLPPPQLPQAQLSQLIGGCRLKEFYVVSSDETDTMVQAMLCFCNNYDYRKSKFYRPDTRELYDRALPGAVAVALEHLREKEGRLLTGENGLSTIVRDVFVGAVCSYRLKRRLEIDYVSFSHTHELRFVITDVLKYAENAIRQAIGVKSRLSVYDVSVALRERLDRYLAQVLPERRTAARRSEAGEVPAYEKRYELPTAPISPDRAVEIEQSSWVTTKRLLEAFEGEHEGEKCHNGVKNDDLPTELPTLSPLARAEAVTAPSASPAEQRGFLESLGKWRDFLPLALSGERGAQRRFAEEKGVMLDAVVDEINTVAADFLGDVLLEEQNGAYAVIEDYLDWLKEQKI